MRKMPPKHLQMAHKLELSYVAPADAHNVLLRPTYVYFHPLHSTLLHIICVNHSMSSGNVKSCEKSCGITMGGNPEFLLQPVVVARDDDYHIW
jgi:hypothetical protein